MMKLPKPDYVVDLYDDLVERQRADQAGRWILLGLLAIFVAGGIIAALRIAAA